ncbi:hypothetical protein [Streptomyces erythrochromogenes]|uniref:hypothetical protein n=1 Tax=Streptomyces erythrochromogenes TaxID=285574 RepID=UPI00387016A6|nr:hypothetical protein OG364_29510 [Streptomyces erythrochromogenes]
MTDMQTVQATATGAVYALVDPRVYEVRYVGQTGKPLAERLAGHLVDPAPRVREWIASLTVDGVTPDIIPLVEGVPLADLDRVEREEIEAHSARGDLLNTVNNRVFTDRRRKENRAEKKRREAAEKEMTQRWNRAVWRKVADQVREATGGPFSPADVLVRPIPAPIWATYRVYRVTHETLKAKFAAAYPKIDAETAVQVGVECFRQPNRPDPDPEMTALQTRRTLTASVLESYCRAYTGAFAAVDEGGRYGTEGNVSGRGGSAYETEFRDADHMARYMSLIAWAGRALDPWVALARKAGMDVTSAEFTEWVSDDADVRSAVAMYQATAPGWLGTFRQTWDFALPDYALALGSAHIPGFVVPGLLSDTASEALSKAASDRQATTAMCGALLRLAPGALDAVYGRDELAEADAALGLPAGTSARVARCLYGDNLEDPKDRTSRLLQRHTGTFDTVTIPTYSGWSGPSVPGWRLLAASLYSAGLLPRAEAGDGEALVAKVKNTWKPTESGIAYLEERESALLAHDTGRSYPTTPPGSST